MGNQHATEVNLISDLNRVRLEELILFQRDAANASRIQGEVDLALLEANRISLVKEENARVAAERSARNLAAIASANSVRTPEVVQTDRVVQVTAENTTRIKHFDNLNSINADHTTLVAAKEDDLEAAAAAARVQANTARRELEASNLALLQAAQRAEIEAANFLREREVQELEADTRSVGAIINYSAIVCVDVLELFLMFCGLCPKFAKKIGTILFKDLAAESIKLLTSLLLANDILTKGYLLDVLNMVSKMFKDINLRTLLKSLADTFSCFDIVLPVVVS
jgi:hypothetical protein